ncbi:MAG: hypothetical protein KTR35_17135 [Gammaproteobacteria bacterium]|nr:hypothetical protein [Gammaproteobacteria bacterium]
MTIGIVARGEKAGVALVSSLGAIEHVAEGAVAGFVSLVVFDERNSATFFESQTGGVTGLFGNLYGFIEADTLPREIQEATRAGLISSGPHRPSPLSRFLAWDENGNIVSGHRFPQTPAQDGTPLNQSVLLTLQATGDNSKALQQVLEKNEFADAGIVALDTNNNVYCEDTKRVKRRGDTASVTMCTKNYSFGFSMNSIYPPTLIAELLTVKLSNSLRKASLPKQSHCISIKLDAEILKGAQPKVHINDNLAVMSIVTAETCWFENYCEGALLETGTPILLDGMFVGTILEESYITASNGNICSLSGQNELTLQYTKHQTPIR